MIKAVLFDIDGVLLDSEESNRDFLRRLFKEFGYKAPSKEEYRKVFHLNLWDVIEVLTKEQNRDKIQQIWNRGSSYPDYEDEFLKTQKGLDEVIKELNKSYKLGIVTGRVQSGVDEFFNFSGLKNYFDTVVCYDDYSKSKPHPEGLLLAISKLDVRPEEAVYVGDAQTDMIAAEKAGIHFILFPENPKIKTKFVAKQFGDIPEILEDYFARK